MWKSTSNDGAGRAANRSQQWEQKLRTKRRQRYELQDSPELRAVCKAFDCDLPRARKILAAARRQS